MVTPYSINLAPEHSFLDWEGRGAAEHLPSLLTAGSGHQRTSNPNLTSRSLSGTRGLEAFGESKPEMAGQSSSKEEIYRRVLVSRSHGKGLQKCSVGRDLSCADTAPGARENRAT